MTEKPTSDEIVRFNDSLVRCLATDDFVGHFYELFVGSSSEVAHAFRNTDFSRQKRMLRSSLYMMVMAAEGEDRAMEYLEEIAARHGRGDLGIRPGLYDDWLDCLVQAASAADPEWTEETERTWRRMMGYGVEFMRERY